VQSFIGEKSGNVIRELGLPNELLSDGDKQFMVYSAKSADTEFLMIIWLPVMAMRQPGNTLHCLRFELDSDNVVKEYRLESRVMKTFVLVVDVELTSSCKEVFWSSNERTKLRKVTDFPSTWEEIQKQQSQERHAEREKREQRERRLKQAEEKRQQQVDELFQQATQGNAGAKQGNADAQLALFKSMRYENPKEALRWLCRSADQGNQYASHILGSIYSREGFSWIDRSLVRRDYQLAYMWYSFGGQMDGEMLHSFAGRHLNAAELSEAENLLREWAPGQCERDLGLVSSTE
jgi:hypothetical protein